MSSLLLLAVLASPVGESNVPAPMPNLDIWMGKPQPHAWCEQVSKDVIAWGTAEFACINDHCADGSGDWTEQRPTSCPYPKGRN